VPTLGKEQGASHLGKADYGRGESGKKHVSSPRIPGWEIHRPPKGITIREVWISKLPTVLSRGTSISLEHAHGIMRESAGGL